MCQELSTVNVGISHERFAPGTHICLVFRDESERQRIVSRFVGSGVAEHENVGYFADTANPDEVIAWLESLDVDISQALANESFTVSAAVDVYCPHGTFVPQRMYDRLKESYRSSREAGFANTRVTGEMTWALRGIAGSDRLIEYESGINTVVKTHPITAMCQYDANQFSGALIYQALQVHPFMVVNGQLIKNPYFIAGE